MYLKERRSRTKDDDEGFHTAAVVLVVVGGFRTIIWDE